MKKLYINYDYKGEVRGWHKNEMLNRYSFLMMEGYYISVDIDNIVSLDDIFGDSNGDIYIRIYGQGGTNGRSIKTAESNPVDSICLFRLCSLG